MKDSQIKEFVQNLMEKDQDNIIDRQMLNNLVHPIDKEKYNKQKQKVYFWYHVENIGIFILCYVLGFLACYGINMVVSANAKLDLEEISGMAILFGVLFLLSLDTIFEPFEKIKTHRDNLLAPYINKSYRYIEQAKSAYPDLVYADFLNLGKNAEYLVDQLDFAFLLKKQKQADNLLNQTKLLPQVGVLIKANKQISKDVAHKPKNYDKLVTSINKQIDLANDLLSKQITKPNAVKLISKIIQSGNDEYINLLPNNLKNEQIDLLIDHVL